MGPMENRNQQRLEPQDTSPQPQPTWPSAASPAGASAVEAFAFWKLEM